MAYTRVSPGIWKDENGRIIRSAQDPNKGGAAQPQKGKPGTPNPLGVPKDTNQLNTAQTQLSQQATGAAQQALGDSNGWGTFNPTLTDRVNSGDVIKDRQRIEEEAYGRLTRSTDQDYKKERDQLEQTLVGRGIPVGSAAYNNQISQLDKRYDTLRQDARARSAEMGGQELSRSYDTQEQLRANQFSEQSGIRNQRIGETERLGAIGQGGIKNYGDLKSLQLQQRQIQAAIDQLKRSGGGRRGDGRINPNGSSGDSPFLSA